MAFRPNVGDELTLNGVTYRIAEHPAAPGIPYGQEGRAGIVYQLLPSPTGRGTGDEGAMALKVFRARFRTPALVSQAEKLAAFADLPGLTVCRRTVLTPQRNADLLRREPDLTYAVLMPWIEGPTWTEVMLEKRPLTPQQALDLARAFADILSRMEQNGIAHCDLSGPNVLLPMLAQQTAYRPPSTVELVDVEGLYAPGLPRPEALPSGSSGYAHRTAREGLWGPTADRFAGAVLLAEMLCWGDESVRQACYGETYFDPAEMPAQGGANPPRYQTLLSALARHYGQPVADLFERAWTSETLADCPTFGEWLVALPEHPVAQAFSLSTPAAETTAGEQPTSPQESAAVDATAEIRAFMQAARRMEDKGNLEGALALYRQALELAGADPSLRSLAREIELTVQDVEKRIAAQARRPQPAISPLPPGAPFGDDKGEAVREQPRRTNPWGWVVAGLTIFALLAVLVYGVNLQQQQAAQATATAIAWQEQSAATAQAQATATAQAQATATAQAQATVTARVRITQTAIARATATSLAITQNRIVFAQQDGIYTINPDGTDLKQVVQINAPCTPAWSPDKKQIAFAAFCSTPKKQEIYIVEVDGSGLKRITNNQSTDGWPAWSPDGRSLAFESDRDGDFEIYVIDNIENPTNVRQLTYNHVLDGGPAWSPDGEIIAFHSQRENTGGIYTMRPDGTNVTRVITSSSWIGGPDWSPNGNLIAFDGYYKGGFATIYTLTYLNPGSPKQLISTGDNWHPSWSPDGNWIVFLHSSGLWKVKSDGSRIIKIFDGSYAPLDPDW